ncbi:hypothetical protein [Aquifex aeolicus]|uniref:hypothetical protein n=1 Tax=Aquifex aeolicus TaxID=63363 RepID=UPI0002FD2E85|nr:hypothetical protein [Aquifex aeolicus]
MAELVEEFNSFSEELKRILSGTGLLQNFFGKKERKDIKRMFLQARTINFKGKAVFMPFIDFINHDVKKGVPYDVREDAIVVRAKPDER